MAYQRVLPEEIVNRWMILAMNKVGARFERPEYFTPGMLIAARAMQAGLACSGPCWPSGQSRRSGPWRQHTRRTPGTGSRRDPRARSSGAFRRGSLTPEDYFAGPQVIRRTVVMST